MPRSIDWQSVAQPLDVAQITPSAHHIRRWLAYHLVESGVIFDCRTAGERPATCRIDVVEPDVVRLRLQPLPLEDTLARDAGSPSDILVRADWQAPPFQLAEEADQLVLTTERLRLEFQRRPWQMRVYERAAWNSWLDQDGEREGSRSPRPRPIFCQRIDDRAYGPGYEVLPTGFDEGSDGRLTARETVAVSPGEAFYGFGEKFTPLDKWGQEIVSWSVDSGNVSSHRSYKNVPFFLSTAGYGVFIHSSYPIIYRMGTESSISYSFHVAEPCLDYFLIIGPRFQHILGRYCDLTGWPALPPKWSFGFWISRAGYRTQQEVLDVAQEMRARDLPVDVISLDPWWMGDGPWSTYRWDQSAFPEPARMIAGLREQGTRTCLWIHPWVPIESDLFEEGRARGLFVRRADGSVAPVREAFSGTSHAAIDFTNPDAVAWLEEKLEPLLDMGVATFKTDFGEQAPVDGVYHDGRNGLEMHNLYPLIYNQAVWELTRRRFGRGLVWGRSGYAGSQRYPVQWGGDSYSSLDQLRCQLRGLLSYGMSGVPFCSHDVGGFDYSPSFFDHVEAESFHDSFDPQHLRNYPKDAVVYVRWLQVGAFSSHMRAHGKQSREPWAYGPEVEAIARRYLKLRYRLLPYIYSQAVEATRTALPMVRPMVLAHQDDLNTRGLDRQYLFGDDLLVAPVLSYDHGCEVYLPEGRWIDFWSKLPVAGGRWLRVTPALEDLPVWVRAGAIIPMGPDLDFVDQKPLDPLTLELYAPEEEGETVIRGEDQPDLAVRYWREGERLVVEMEAAPGQVEMVLYGLKAHAAGLAGKRLSLETRNGGQVVRFDGRRPGRMIFQL